MVGIHFQSGTPGWLEAIAKLPAGTWQKVVNDQHMCGDLKAANPGLKVVFRYHYTSRQRPSPDYDQNVIIARRFFNAWMDGSFWEQELWRPMDGVEEWNEYLANSQDETERAMWLSWLTAVCDVWAQIQVEHPEIAHIPLVCCNTAVGNDILIDFADVVYDHDNILSYHGYTFVEDGKLKGNYGEEENPGKEWRWQSGRWTAMDSEYRQAGIYVKWLATEGGAYYSANEGWRGDRCYGGDLDAYMTGAMAHNIDRASAWNEQHGHRFLGYTLFTSGDPGSVWDLFELKNHLHPVCEFIRDYVPDQPPPPPPPPPPDDDMEQAFWGISIEEQTERGIWLNPLAGLQRKIIEDGLLPVHRELYPTWNGETIPIMAGEHPENIGERWLYIWQDDRARRWRPE